MTTLNSAESLLALLFDLIGGSGMEFLKRLVSDLVHAELTIACIIAWSLRFLIIVRVSTMSSWRWSSCSPSHTRVHATSWSIWNTSSEAWWRSSSILWSNSSSSSPTLSDLALVELSGSFEMELLVLYLSSLMRQIAWRQSFIIIIFVLIVVWTSLIRVRTRGTPWLLSLLLATLSLLVGSWRLDVIRTANLKNVKMKLITYFLAFLKMPGSLSF